MYIPNPLKALAVILSVNSFLVEATPVSPHSLSMKLNSHN